MALILRLSLASLSGETTPLLRSFLPLPRIRISTTYSSSFSSSVAAAASSKRATEAVEGKRARTGFTTPLPVSPELQAFLGVSEIPRTQVLKAVWAYIKQNNLQDPENKKIVVCDEKLKKIFAGKDRVGFLEVPGLIGRHFPRKA
ncbi:hypothetical protein Dimus_026397 [Dionaea muscipula]